MLPDGEAAELRQAHREFERARDRVWLERVRAGLEHRRALREIDEGVARVRLERDRQVREAVAAGASYREVARALGLSHSRIQQIVGEGRVRPGLGRSVGASSV
jgi:DNA invertase Pin-like site-specific DNA recombinase